MQKHKKTDVNS